MNKTTLSLHTFLFLTLNLQAQTLIEPYGFLKGSYLFSNRALDSNGNTNLVAPMKALPDASTDSNAARATFEVVQSRFGFHIQPEENTSGTLEMDFVDFAKASAGTKAVPRLRIASLKHKWDRAEILVGQDWDTFSPAKPWTFNYVGLFFNAGNAGFMRPQIKYSYLPENLHFDVAIGLAGTNANPADADLEKNIAPSLAARASRMWKGYGELGVSAIVGRLRFSTPTVDYATFYGLNAFAEIPLGESTQSVMEVYYGQNLANTGTLTLAQVLFPTSLHEWGGYLSIQHSFNPAARLIGGVGYSQIVEETGVEYSGVSGLTLRSNGKASAAFAQKIGQALEIFLEESIFLTQWRVTSDASTNQVLANLMEVGGVLTF